MWAQAERNASENQILPPRRMGEVSVQSRRVAIGLHNLHLMGVCCPCLALRWLAQARFEVRTAGRRKRRER
jgi:hypothetical protein